MSATVLSAENSSAALSPDNPTRRRPRAERRERPPAFAAAFDARTLFYDCFRHGDGEVLLVGPPPMNLSLETAAARFVAQPSGAPLAAQAFVSLSTAITRLRGVPADTAAVRADVAGETLVLPVQPSATEQLRGRRLSFSINRDNDLAWIREWATFHAKVHGTDAVILVDNGSSRYGADEIEATLRAVPGLAFVAVPRWPYPFGPFDPAVTANPFWARFLQIGSMSMVLRRYGEAADGLLDCDIDELAGTRSGTSIYDLAKKSRGGIVAFTGTWIEAVGGGARHRDFTLRRAGRDGVSPRRKWALDPLRGWVRRLSVHPYWHWIEGRPLLAKSMPEDALYWHFRAINTNWKQDRTAPPNDDAVLESDPLLVKTFARLEP